MDLEAKVSGPIWDAYESLTLRDREAPLDRHSELARDGHYVEIARYGPGRLIYTYAPADGPEPVRESVLYSGRNVAGVPCSLFISYAERLFDIHAYASRKTEKAHLELEASDATREAVDRIGRFVSDPDLR